MSSAESEKGLHASDEACAQIWDVYLREAEQYDHSLVKSWKEDMDVTLVFSGLYSAVLSAFIVESYQSLQQDQSELSVTLLAHISGQLASLSSANNIPISLKQDFRPSRSAVACNVLWFLSLILALLCALLATFVQQWTRQFLHRTSILRTPAARARLISFLYFGLRNFKMHTIVDVIPFLLHLSLFTFFGGLVAFLQPINAAIEWLVIGSLVLIAVFYAFFTTIPVLNLSSPYQTPLSPILWRTWQSLRWTAETFTNLRFQLKRFRQEDPNVLPTSSRRQYNLTYAMVSASNQNRRQREAKSLAWTLRSLTDDIEFLPFVEALPDVIYEIHGVLHINNLHLLKPILETADPEIDIISRIFALFMSSQSFWMKEIIKDRVVEAIPDALWSLAYVLNRRPQDFDLRKTGRTSWFSWEQVRLLERHREYLGAGWMNPTINLIRSNMLLCHQLDLHRRDPRELGQCIAKGGPSPRDNREQSLILLGYIHEMVTRMKTHTISIPTFHALSGHEDVKQLDLAPIHQKLIEHVISIASDEEEENISTSSVSTDSSVDEDLILGDEIGYSVIQLCRKEDVAMICQYLNARTNLKESYSMLLLWAPLYKRENDHIPAYRPLLQSILEGGFYSESCVKALRELLWCFDKYPGREDPHWIHIYHLPLNPRWWSDLEPTWLDILDQLEELEDGVSRYDHRVLAVMIKATVLKKCSSHETAGQEKQFDLLNFIDSRISPFTGTQTQPKSLSINSALVALVVQLLEEMRAPSLQLLKDIREVLRFLCIEDLTGAPYTVDPTIMRQFAAQTKRYCEFCRESPSTGLLGILRIIWALWEPGYSTSSGQQDMLLGTIRQTPDVARDIIAAADILLDMSVKLNGKFDKKEEGSEPASPSSTQQEDIERIKKIRRYLAADTGSSDLN